MTVTAKLDRSDAEYIRQLLVSAERKTEKFANNSINRIAIVFFRAAAKRTGPGPIGSTGKSKIKSMAKKHRIKPVVTLTMKNQRLLKEFWYKDRVKNKIFMLRKEISLKSRFGQTVQGDDSGPLSEKDNSRLIPVKRAIKYWDKKRKRWGFRGTDKQRGLNGGNIPGAGAGKAGWIQGLRNLGVLKGTDTGKLSKRVGTTRIIRGKNPLISHTNQVDYVSKIAPSVIRKSLGVTASYFRAAEKKKFLKKMERSL